MFCPMVLNVKGLKQKLKHMLEWLEVRLNVLLLLLLTAFAK